MASGSELKFVIEYVVCPPNSDLSRLLVEMDQCTSDAIYKNLIDKILKKYITEYDLPWGVYVRNVLIEVFARTNSRKNLRKYMYEKLNTNRLENRMLFECIVHSVTNEFQENLNNLNIFRITQCSKILCFLLAFIQSCSNNPKFHYFLEIVFPFYLCIMEVFTSQLYNNNFSKPGCEGKGILQDDDCYKVLCLTLKQLSFTLHKVKCDGLKPYAVRMVILTHEVMHFHNQLKFETISKCSLVFAYFSLILPEEEIEMVKHKELPMLDFLDNPENDYCMVLASKKLKNLFDTETMQVVLNMAVHSVFGQYRPLEYQVAGKPIVEFVYINLTDLASKITAHAELIRPVSRTFVPMVRHLALLENFGEIFERALAFTWIHIDHFCDKVVSHTKDFLRSMVIEAELLFQRGEQQHLAQFFVALNARPVFSRVRLNALFCISQVLNCDYILANCPHVQNQLLIIATHSAEHDMAGQVYTNMMLSYLRTRSDQEIVSIWMQPVLAMLKKQLKYYYILEKIMMYAFYERPTIFRKLFNPARGGTERECAIMLKCIHHIRTQGITIPMDPGAVPAEYWRDLVQKSKLDLFMLHQGEEVRIDVLQAIAECQRTTEILTKWEFNFLIKYLEYNIATQTASIRNKISGFYKKALVRYHIAHVSMVRRAASVEIYLKQNTPYTGEDVTAHQDEEDGNATAETNVADEETNADNEGSDEEMNTESAAPVEESTAAKEEDVETEEASVATTRNKTRVEDAEDDEELDPEARAVAYKEALNEKKAHTEVLNYYNNFFIHFLQLLVLYLSPDANYSRRYICLDLLITVQPFCTDEEWQSYFQEDDIKNLKHLLSDSYESIKQMAVRVLRTFPPEMIGFDNEENTRKFYEQSLSMACDIRPSQSVAASYMFQVSLHANYDFRTHENGNLSLTQDNQCLMLLSIAEKLEDMFGDGKQNVVEAAKSTPFYGLLLSFRNLLRYRDIRREVVSYAFIFTKVANLCLAMKDHIMPVVCNTAPEGRVPSDNSEESDDSFLESDQASKAQRILVYSWKTMKEIMLLLAELANETVTLENVFQMLPEEYLVKIGNFFVEIFIRTKHRGVFEQAYAAFTTVCRSYIHSKSKSLNNLAVRWLSQGVALCTGAILNPELIATRRSAGLPFLILSILPTYSETHREHVHRSMESLLSAAHRGNDEIRMHCFNVLRFLFKNAKLSDCLTVYLDTGTIAALNGFRSKTYGVRNSAHLLLASLITRLFGTPNKNIPELAQEENRMTVAVFYVRFKKLFEFLLSTLEEECEKDDSLILHPVLLILSKLYPAHNEDINEEVKRHIPCINLCIRNPSYTTRDLAARASVSLISEYYLINQLTENFVKISKGNITDTECHGLLLQICYILHTTDIDHLPLSDFLLKSMHLLSQPGERYSHLTVTLYIDIVFMLLTKYRTYRDLDVLKQIVVLMALKTKEEEITTCKAAYEYSHFQLLVYILLNKFQHVDSTYPIVTRIILKALYSTDIQMKKKCLCLLIYLNEQFSNDQYKEHPLITAGDVEICPQIKALVHSFDFKSKKELLTYTHPYLISFFYAELKSESRIAEDYFILVYLLLRFYPCFFSSLHTTRRQNILDWFLTMTKIDSEEITAGVIACLKTFVMTLDLEDMKHLRYADLIRLLMESAAPSAADYRRLTVAQFLIGTQVLFKDRILTEYDRYNVLNIVMVLLEDDEAIVRNTMSAFPSKRNRVPTTPIFWNVIPSRARLVLLKTSMNDFHKEVAVCCLTSWALRRLPEVTRDTSEVYERGEMNIFAENIPVTHCASGVLYQLLWTLSYGLSLDDYTIFLEEQTYLVTIRVLDSLIKVPSPMMNLATKRTVICVLKCILKFIEDCTVGKNFSERFREFFYSTILKFLRTSLDTDYPSTKAFLTYLYNPLLNAHFRFPQ